MIVKIEREGVRWRPEDPPPEDEERLIRAVELCIGHAQEKGYRPHAGECVITDVVRPDGEEVRVVFWVITVTIDFTGDHMRLLISGDADVCDPGE